MRKIASTKMKMLMYGTVASAMLTLNSGAMSWGVLTDAGPKMMSARFWRMKDTPIAVMRGATRGALRSGR